MVFKSRFSINDHWMMAFILTYFDLFGLCLKEGDSQTGAQTLKGLAARIGMSSAKWPLHVENDQRS